MGRSQVNVIVLIIVLLAFEAVNLAICVDGDGEIRIWTLSFHGALGRYGKRHLRQSDIWHGCVVSVGSRRMFLFGNWIVVSICIMNLNFRLSHFIPLED